MATRFKLNKSFNQRLNNFIYYINLISIIIYINLISRLNRLYVSDVFKFVIKQLLDSAFA